MFNVHDVSAIAATYVFSRQMVIVTHFVNTFDMSASFGIGRKGPGNCDLCK